jgi:hypothetical protein
VAAAEDGIPQRAAERGVAARAVDDRARDAPTVRDVGEDVAPDRGILAATVVQDHDMSRRHLVDVVADGPGRRGRRSIEDRVRAPRQPERVVERLEAEALTGDAQAVEGVAERCRVERRRALQVAVAHRRSIVS